VVGYEARLELFHVLLIAGALWGDVTHGASMGTCLLAFGVDVCCAVDGLLLVIGTLVRTPGGAGV